MGARLKSGKYLASLPEIGQLFEMVGVEGLPNLSFNSLQDLCPAARQSRLAALLRDASTHLIPSVSLGKDRRSESLSVLLPIYRDVRSASWRITVYGRLLTTYRTCARPPARALGAIPRPEQAPALPDPCLRRTVPAALGCEVCTAAGASGPGRT